MFTNSMIISKDVLYVGGFVVVTVVGIATDVVGVGDMVALFIDEVVEVEVIPTRNEN